MMPYQSYQQWAIERPLTLAEQRYADQRRGEAVAAVSGSLRRLRLRFQRPAAPYLPAGTTPRTARGTQVAGHVPARAHVRAAACNTEV
jgi:hypothetical protein